MATLFNVTLTGQQETPPNASQATGEGRVVWDPQEQVAAYTFTVHGLDFGPVTGAGETTPLVADDVTNAHFHNAPSGVAGPVVFGQIAPAQDDDDLIISQHTDSPVQLGFKRSSQHQPARPSAARQMPRQVFANQASSAACR